MPALKRKENSGFIALITAIVLSAILITTAVALNQLSFFARSEISNAEYKERSIALAEACLDMALLRLAQNPAYPGGEIVTVTASDSCAIRPVLRNTPQSGQNTIETRAVFQEATTNLKIVVKASNFSILSWDEVPSF